MSATLLAGLLLQTTWVVDAASGPGTNFTDLPPAIAMAQSGDTILVRSGGYSGFGVANKSLTIRGAGFASTEVDRSTLVVMAGDRCVLAGIRFRSSGTGLTSGALVAVGSGRLVIEDCEVLAGAIAAQLASGFAITGGAEVFAARCSFIGAITFSTTVDFGGPAVRVSGATFTTVDCSLLGGHVSFGGLGPPVAGDALVVAGGVANLVSTSCRGGSAGSTTFVLGQGGAAVSVDGDVRIAGDATTILQGGGDLLGYPASPGLAVELVAGTATVHDAVTLQPAAPGAAVVSPGVVLGAPLQPRLEFTGTTLSSGETAATQPVAVAFAGLLPNAPFFFAVGLQPDYSNAFAPLLLGELLVDLASGEVVFGMLDGAGRFVTSFVPAMVFAGSLGMPVFSQAGAFDFVLGQFRTSNVDVRIFSL